MPVTPLNLLARAATTSSHGTSFDSARKLYSGVRKALCQVIVLQAADISALRWLTKTMGRLVTRVRNCTRAHHRLMYKDFKRNIIAISVSLHTCRSSSPLLNVTLKTRQNFCSDMGSLHCRSRTASGRTSSKISLAYRSLSHTTDLVPT